MRSWIVSNNFTKKSFTKFKEAVEFFKSLIKSHIEVNEYFYDECGYPTVENKYFYDKLSNALISDNEIVISQRSEMLMSSLLWEEVNKSSEYIRESIKKDYHYSGEGENGEKEFIDIVNKDDELLLQIEHLKDEDKTCVHSNAFIFNNPHLTYYFYSKQEVGVIENNHMVNKQLDAFIKLEAIDSLN